MKYSASVPCDFFSLSSALLCVLNNRGKIIQANPAWQQKLGIVPSKLEQTDFLAWIHSEDRDKTKDYLTELHNGKTSISFCHRWHLKNGDYRWLQWEITVITASSLFSSTSGSKDYRQSFPIFYAIAIDVTAQKIAEKKLHHIEERFELAIQGAAHGLWDWDLHTNEIYFSPRWKNMLGYEENEIVNHMDSLCQHVHPDDFTDMWARIEAYLDKRVAHYESIHRMMHKNGSPCWVLARAAALWDKNDQPYRMVGTYIDITQYKETEYALEENEALLHAIFEVTQIGLCVTNEDDQFVRVNPAFGKLFGYHADELINQSITLLSPPPQRARIAKLNQIFLKKGKEINREWRIIDRYGNPSTLNITIGNLIRHKQQRFAVVTAVDVTKRRRAEEERNRLFNLSVDMQSIVDFDGYFTDLNEAFETTLGWNKNELLKKPCIEFVHSVDKKNTIAAISQLHTGTTMLNFENRYLCKNGQYRWLSWNSYALIDQHSIYSITRDITEKKLAEEKIKQQQEFILLVVDTVPNLILVKDHEDNFIFVNQAAANLLNTSVENLLDPTQPKPNHPLINLELYPKTMTQISIEKHETIIEGQCRNSHGEDRHYHLVKKNFVQGNGNVFILAVGTDITERKQYEEALKQSKKRYQAIVEDQTELICRFLPDYTLSFVNHTFCRYYNKSELDLLNQTFHPFVYTDDYEYVNAIIHQLDASMPVNNFEFRTHAVDGSLSWLQWNVRALFSENDKIIEYQAVGRDVTERKKAEEALRQSEERLRIVTSGAPLILFAIDKQGIITFSRGKALNIFGLKNNQLVGKSIFDEFCRFPDAITNVRRALQGEIVTNIIQVPNFFLETKYSPAYDREGSIIGVIGVSIDISERYNLEMKMKETVAELETILDNSVIGIAYVKAGKFVWVNSKLENLLEYEPETLNELSFCIIYALPETCEQMKQEAYQLFTTGKGYDDRHLLRTRMGKQFWARLVGKAIDSSSINQGCIWIIEDITLQQQAEQDLRLTSAIFETTADGIFVTDLHNRIQRVNPAFMRITGYSTDEILNKKTSCLSSGRHDRQFYEQIWKTIDNIGHWQGEIWNRRKNGEIYVAWLSISVIKNDLGEPLQYMAVLSDISRLQQDIEKMRYLANYDSLTQLPNRMLFNDNLLQAQHRAIRHHCSLAVLFIDLDNFKPVNDQFGHAVGDQLLQQVAERLRNCVRETDTVARFGGDEFTILLNNVHDTQEASEVAQQITHILQQPFYLGRNVVIISASIGIAVYPEHENKIDNLLRKADQAMYQAKNEGKGRFCFYQIP